MIDHVDKRLVFKPLNNRPYLHGETEPCINGRILGIGSYFKEPNDALANQLLSERSKMAAGTATRPKACALRSIPPSACSKDCSNTNEQGANRRPSLRPARGPKLSARAQHVPLASTSECLIVEKRGRPADCTSIASCGLAG
jgi:hypothetical protein